MDGNGHKKVSLEAGLSVGSGRTGALRFVQGVAGECRSTFGSCTVQPSASHQPSDPNHSRGRAVHLRQGSGLPSSGGVPWFASTGGTQNKYQIIVALVHSSSSSKRVGLHSSRIRLWT